jgi:hypothetical protein
MPSSTSGLRVRYPTQKKGVNKIVNTAVLQTYSMISKNEEDAANVDKQAQPEYL